MKGILTKKKWKDTTSDEKWVYRDGFILGFAVGAFIMAIFYLTIGVR